MSQQQIDLADRTSSREPPAGILAPFADRRILFVDDEPLLCLLMQQALEDAGIRIVRTARDGTEALALHAAEPFDIILLNYIMPVMTGIEVLGILRARDDNVPIIMHSGCTRAAVERLCRGLSISRFVQSPFTEPEYLESVRAVLTEEPRTSPSAGETSNDRTRQSSSEGRRK